MDNDEKIIKAFLYETLVNGLLANASLAYYDYMFHWANKCGGWCEDDLF